MPYNYAHALTGFHALKNCKNIASVVRPAHINAFFIGTMGPDPYYGDAYPPSRTARSSRQLADDLHRLDGEALFSALLALSAGSPCRTAYAIGFLCHFVLDNRAHPYIEARFPGALHTPAEIAMDPLLTARANEPRLLVSPAAFYHTDALHEIDALHTALAADLFSQNTRGVYARSLTKWLRLNAFLYDPRGKKLALTRAVPALSRYFLAPRPDEHDLLNLRRAPWSAAGARTDSVPMLIADAEAEICRLIDQIAAGGRTDALAALAGRNADAAGNLSE